MSEIGDYDPPEGSSAALNFRKPYAPPAGNAVGLGFRFIWYHPPKGNQVGLDFSGAYVPPLGNQVGMSFTNDPDEEAPRDDQHLFPAPVLTPSPQLGEVVVRLEVEYVEPFGFSRTEVGILGEVWNFNQIAWPGGLAPRNRYGRPTVLLRDRYVRPSGHLSQNIGTQWLSHWLRYIISPSVGDRTARGTPWVSRSPRHLEPPGPDMMRLLGSHVVGGEREVAPFGWDSQAFGTRIIPGIQTIYPKGFVGEVGNPELELFTRYLLAKGFETNPDDLRFGTHHFWNLRQYVHHQYDPNDGLNPPEIRGWMVVEHRDKFPRAFGWTSSRHGYTFIWNKASAMLPGGIAAPEHPPYYKAGSVTHWVRALAPEELDSLHMGRWGAVYNTADLLRAGIGPDALGFGEPLLENRSRKFDHFGDIDSLGLGEHLVADRVRGIEFEQRYSIHPPVIELPDVRLHTRYFENASVGSWQRVGLAELRIHWTIIETRWSFHPPAFIGMPELRNLTPELGTMGANSEEFGDAAVRTQWREVMTFDGYMTRFGTNIVRDRTHQVMLVTLGPPPAMLPGPVVTKIGGLPEEQHILARPVNFPSTSPLIVVGRPSTNQLSSHVQGFDAVRWGASAVALMGAEGAGNIYSLEMQHEYDVVHHVTLRIRELGVEGIPRLPASFGAPALSPHTIYAVVEAPKQAVENHPLRSLHYVDGYEFKGVGDRTKVTHRVQHVSPRWSAGSNLLGSPTIHNMKNWVQVDGIRSMRFGLPSTPLDLESEQLDPEDGMVVPKPIVSRPEPLHRELRAQGFSGAVGAQLVEFFHRPVYPSGFDDLLVGTRKSNDKPFQWQGLRVGPHVDNIIGGYLTEEWGTAWVSLAIRGLSVPGLDSLGAGFDPDMFKARMRVSLGTKSLGPSSQEVVCGAGETFGGGLPFVSNMAHYILPDGNSEQYRKGAQSA